MRRRLASALIALSAACSSAPAPRPAVEPPPAAEAAPRTTRFAAKVDVAPLLQAGCTASGEGLDCTRGELERFGCIGPAPVEGALGALTPRVAIVACNGREGGGLDEGLAVLGCGAAAVARRYLVVSGGKVSLLRTEAELAARFAPVETPEEALAFALATSKARALSEVIVPAGAVRRAARIEPTYVAATARGFEVHLFDVRVCGCGPHDWEAVDILVTRAGEVKELGREAIYEDPTLSGACAD